MKKEADWEAIAREEMRFFGDVSASISHEINNRFAVINEKAGLLGDLAAMLVRGKEIDLGRFEIQSKKIVEQVRLAKQTVRDLNRFAHSVDGEHCRIDVGELLDFVVGLYSRKAAAEEATLSVSRSSEAVAVTMNPFFLQTLIGRAVDISLAVVGNDGKVAISVGATRGGFTVRFEGLAGLTEPICFPEEHQDVSALLECLGARYGSEQDGSALLLEIPDQKRTAHGRTE